MTVAVRVIEYIRWAAASNQSDVANSLYCRNMMTLDTVEHTCSAIKSVYYKNENHLGCSIYNQSVLS